jgi:hypothetical protein
MSKTLSPIHLRIEGEIDKVTAFLKQEGYPFDWDYDRLSETLMVRAFTDDDQTAAYFWGQWADTGVLSFHVCVGKSHYGLCFRQNLIDRLGEIAFMVGADEMLTSVDGLPNGDRIAQLMLRHGFVQQADRLGKPFVYTRNLWKKPHG